MDFRSLLTLRRNGPTVFTGRSARYTWGGVYGGQVAAQALRAAQLTVPPVFCTGGIHATYISPADAARDLRFDVEATRDGRLFAWRTVRVTQGGQTVLHLLANFRGDRDAPDVQLSSAPVVPPPEQCPPGGWSDGFDRRFVNGVGQPGRVHGWLRLLDPIDDDPRLHDCGLVYLADDLPGDAVMRIVEPDLPPAADLESASSNWSATSLDYAVWFHSRARADAWHLGDYRCIRFTGQRGHVVGRLYDRDGVQLATVAQDVLVRRARPS